MLGNRLTAAVVSLADQDGTSTPPLGDDRVETVAYPSLDPWLPKPSENATAARLGSSAPPPTSDCLVIVGASGEIHRQQLVAQISDTFRGLPIVVISKSPPLGVAVGVMRQGAYAVASDSDSADALVTTVHAAAKEGRLNAAKRQHLLNLRRRIAELTAPERQVLNSMLEGMANKQIAQALQIGLRTVELRRSKIMRKMGARSLAELVKFVCLVMPAETAEPPTSDEAAMSASL